MNVLLSLLTAARYPTRKATGMPPAAIPLDPFSNPLHIASWQRISSFLKRFSCNVSEVYQMWYSSARHIEEEQ